MVGCDDGTIQIYNYSTSEHVKEVEAHTDYVRCLIVHDTLPYVISCSDDLSIKMWDFDNKWQEVNSFDDHEHYIMDLAFNPKD